MRATRAHSSTYSGTKTGTSTYSGTSTNPGANTNPGAKTNPGTDTSPGATLYLAEEFLRYYHRHNHFILCHDRCLGHGHGRENRNEGQSTT